MYFREKDIVSLFPRSSASQRRTLNKKKKALKKVDKMKTKKMKNEKKEERMTQMGFISENDDGPPTPINRSFMDENGWMEMSEYMHEDKLDNTGAGSLGKQGIR